MKYILCATLVSLVLILSLHHQAVSCQEQRVVRRLVRVGANGARVRLLGARAVPPGSPEQVVGAEKGAVSEISSKEADNFGQRSSTNETLATTSTTSTTTTSTPSPSSTTAPSTTTTTHTSAPTTSSAKPAQDSLPLKASAAVNSPLKPAGSPQEVELLSSAPSSWQSMMAVEAPAAMLVALENAPVNDLASVSSSERQLLENLPQPADFLRGPTKGGKLVVHESHETKEHTKVNQQQQQQQQQQAFFYPRKHAQVFSKTSQTKGVKGHWYQPTTTTSTTPKPAPLVQEYEQEQYQQQVEYGPAPLGEAEPFAFDFKTLDSSGNGQYRKEESDKNGVVRGSYGYTDANGIYRHVDYIADADGFRASIKSNEPGLIGETQPASIQYSAGGVPAAAGSPSQRFSAPSRSDNSDWIPEAVQPNTANNNNDNINSPVGELAMASPNFESSHKPERIRLPRNYRN